MGWLEWDDDSSGVVLRPLSEGVLRVVNALGEGGMGTVSLAAREEGGFRHLYALKRLHPAVRDDPDARAAFLDEGGSAGLLRHPNVVAVLDVGEDAEGPFLLLEYVDGCNLRELLASLAAPPPLQVALELVRDVALGLRAAHELRDWSGRPMRLVHRDVSPQNVLIGRDGSVRLSDFGISKALGVESESTRSLLKGKLSYMSPEQLRFQPPDERSDLYALGVVLVETLLVERLYRGRPDAIARAILEEAPPDLVERRPDAPDGLVEFVFDILAKDPADRVPSAREAVRRLEELVAEVADEEAPVSARRFLAHKLASWPSGVPRA